MPETTLWNGAASSVFDLDGNWSGSKPATGDTAIMPDGNTVAVAGADVTAYELAEWTVRAGYSGTIGSRTAGAITNLQVDADTVNLAGSGTAYINLTGVATCNVTAAAAGSPSTGLYGLTLSGATIGTLKIDLDSGQSVGVAALAGQTCTATNIDIDGAGTVVLGSGLTTTTVTIAGTGTVYIDCAYTTLTISGSPTVYQRSGTGTTLLAYGGRFYNNTSSAITTTSVFDGASVILTDGPQDREMTNINVYGDGAFDDSNKRLATCVVRNFGSGVNIKLGSNNTLTRT